MQNGSRKIIMAVMGEEHIKFNDYEYAIAICERT